MDKSNLIYQGEHIFPAASCSLLSNSASPSRACGPRARGGSDGCWLVVKVGRTRGRMAVTWPTGFTAGELLLGRTDEQGAPGQHVHFVGGRRGCCWSWNCQFKQGFHSKISLKQIQFFFLFYSTVDFPLCSGEVRAGCSAAGNRLSSPALQRQSGQACLPDHHGRRPPPQRRRALPCPYQSAVRCQRATAQMATLGWCHVP